MKLLEMFKMWITTHGIAEFRHLSRVGGPKFVDKPESAVPVVEEVVKEKGGSAVHGGEFTRDAEWKFIEARTNVGICRAKGMG